MPSQWRSCPTLGGDANAIDGSREGGCGHVGRRSSFVAVFACAEAYDGAETGAESRGGRCGYIGRRTRYVVNPPYRLAWTLGGSLRLKRPHDSPDADTFYAASPWVDVDALYVRTGELNRPGFAAAAGVSVPVGQSRTFWVGPFVRYFQIVQPNTAGFDDHDAKLVSIGLSLEVGSGVERPREAVAAGPVAVLPAIHTEPLVCPDRDRDGVPDSVDRCPDVVGTADNYGCPEYKKIIVRRDKLELKEKLYFAWNQAELQDASFPVLDEVVQALRENSSFHVAVEGNTSSEGSDDHNQALSEGRAQAVLDYLVAHGIAKERLTSKGFASSRPVDTNTTLAGRENNRRVESVVHFNILNDGSK